MTHGDLRATSSLLGLALGDAMGWPTEFLDTETIDSRFGPWRTLALPEPAVVTDDTQMALAVGEALAVAEDSGFTPARFREALIPRFIAWNDSPDNNRAPGRTCVRACDLLAAGRSWERATQKNSKGCGANMRVAPLGLSGRLDAEQRAAGAQLQAALTHGHPTALAASDLTAHAIHLLTAGTAPSALPDRLHTYARANRALYHGGWLGDVLWRAGGHASPERYIGYGWDECLKSLDDLECALDAADSEADPCLATGEGWTAEEALATALHSFLLMPGQPLHVLRRAAHTGGDSDSIAAIAGALAGAHVGAAAWPTTWSAGIEYRHRLLALGSRWDRDETDLDGFESVN